MERIAHAVYMAALSLAAIIIIWWLAQSDFGLILLGLIAAIILLGQKKGAIP